MPTKSSHSRCRAAVNNRSRVAAIFSGVHIWFEWLFFLLFSPKKKRNMRNGTMSEEVDDDNEEEEDKSHEERWVQDWLFGKCGVVGACWISCWWWWSCRRPWNGLVLLSFLRLVVVVGRMGSCSCRWIMVPSFLVACMKGKPAQADDRKRGKNGRTDDDDKIRQNKRINEKRSKDAGLKSRVTYELRNGARDRIYSMVHGIRALHRLLQVGYINRSKSRMTVHFGK